MKKIICILVAVSALLISTTQTQAQNTLKSQYNASVDTVGNVVGQTKYLTLNTSAGSFKGSCAVVVTVTEISGTTGGTVSCEASVDGVAWYSIYCSMDSAFTFTPLDQAGAQSYRFLVPAFADNFVRAKYVGTGTMAAKITGKAYFKN